MRLRKRKGTEVKLEITFDRETRDLLVLVKPEDTRPTEIIQILMLAINVINEPLKEELKKNKEENRKVKLPYVG